MEEKCKDSEVLISELNVSYICLIEENCFNSACSVFLNFRIVHFWCILKCIFEFLFSYWKLVFWKLAAVLKEMENMSKAGNYGR